MPGSSEYERLCTQLPAIGLVHHKKRIASGIIKNIQGLSDQALLGGTIKDQNMAKAVRVGLFLSAGGWEEAHQIAQEMDTPEASYWHGIVHRREPDPGNAKYWFRRLEYHSVFEELARDTTRDQLTGTTAIDLIMKSGQWDPFRFIDLCTACEEGQRPELRGELESLQQREITLLLAHCVQGALG